MCVINDLFGIKVIVSNSNEPSFYPFIVKINECSGSCNNIDDPYAKSVFLMLLETWISKCLI